MMKKVMETELQRLTLRESFDDYHRLLDRLVYDKKWKITTAVFKEELKEVRK